jgi:hypothetical protein
MAILSAAQIPIQMEFLVWTAVQRGCCSSYNQLPAYVSNGVIGLRVRETALNAGLTLVSGYTGEHQVRRIEAAAVAPYPYG